MTPGEHLFTFHSAAMETRPYKDKGVNSPGAMFYGMIPPLSRSSERPPAETNAEMLRLYPIWVQYDLYRGPGLSMKPCGSQDTVLSPNARVIPPEWGQTHLPNAGEWTGP